MQSRLNSLDRMQHSIEEFIDEQILITHPEELYEENRTKDQQDTGYCTNSRKHHSKSMRTQRS